MGFRENQIEELEFNSSVIKEEHMRCAMLKPRLFIDGKQWCCLYGDDLQNGIAGFGDTPHKAIMDWEGAFNQSLI